MAEVLDWQSVTDPHGTIQQAVQALNAGQLVALPTDTGAALVASAFCPDAIQQMLRLRGSGADDPITLALADPDQALDWAPQLSPLGCRLLRRCWSEPIIFLVSDGLQVGLLGSLPEAVREIVCPPGAALALQFPAHGALLHVLSGVPTPLLLCHTVQRVDRPVPVSTVLDQLADELALVVDDGDARTELPASLIRIEEERWTVFREGAVSSAQIQRQLAWLTVFVCTGNTCRSPMAAALFAQLVADRLGCAPNELPDRGFLILSAGVSAYPGDEAAVEAIEAVHHLGAELTGHRSQPLTAELVQSADLLLTMTRSHQSAVLQRFGSLNPRPRLLCPEGEDIADPIGFPQDVYNDCAQQILRRLERLLSELPLP